MSSHSREQSPRQFKRLKNVRIERTQQGSQLYFGQLYGSWPALAKRLNACGYKTTPNYSRSRISLSTDARVEEVLSLLKGRREVRNPKGKWLVFSTAALAPVLLVTLFASKHEAKMEPEVVPKTRSCSADKIKDWLETETSSTDMTLLDGVLLGGVRVGTLTCDNTRYSYALELTEPGRVLKLEKLDP